MLEQALIHQREILGERLIHYNTLAGSFLTSLLEIEAINQREVSDDVFRHLAIIARLVDNLIDDEKIEFRDIEKQVSEDTQIQELREFILKLDETQKHAFLDSGKIAIRCMGYYNESQKTSSRLREGSALARMYMSICGASDRKSENFLKSFFQASYMFCDLKHIGRDRRKMNEIFKSLAYLFGFTGKVFYYSKNRKQITRLILKFTFSSLLSDFKK